MSKTILVIGGTGMLGQPVAQRLKSDGFRVRIMTRQRQKASNTFDSSYEIITGDPLSNTNLNEALGGCQFVHLNLPAGFEDKIASAVISMVNKNVVERISCITGATVAEENRWFPPTDKKFRAEQAIRDSGIPYTIFRPSWFMESLPRFVVKGRAAVFGKQPHPFCWIAAEDYARMVSNAFQREEAVNKTFYIFGPEPILMYDALQQYCQACHPEIKKVSVMPFLMVKTIAFLTKNKQLKFAGTFMEYFEKVVESGDATEANSILGAPETTLAQWIKNRC